MTPSQNTQQTALDALTARTRTPYESTHQVVDAEGLTHWLTDEEWDASGDAVTMTAYAITYDLFSEDENGNPVDVEAWIESVGSALVNCLPDAEAWGILSRTDALIEFVVFNSNDPEPIRAGENDWHRAARAQGLGPVLAVLADDPSSPEYAIENTGGMCLAIVRDLDGGKAVVTAASESWDVLHYAGSSWDDGEVEPTELYVGYDVVAAVEYLTGARA